MSSIQDRDADGMITKLFSSIGHENTESEKDTLQAIFQTIDTDQTGSCSIDELTESLSICPSKTFFEQITDD